MTERNSGAPPCPLAPGPRRSRATTSPPPRRRPWATAPVGFGTSPAYGGGRVYAENGAGGSPGLCVDPTGSGDVTKTHVKWQVAKAPGSYASPVIAGDYVFKAHKENMLTCWSLAT